MITWSEPQEVTAEAIDPASTSFSEPQRSDGTEAVYFVADFDDILEAIEKFIGSAFDAPGSGDLKMALRDLAESLQGTSQFGNKTGDDGLLTGGGTIPVLGPLMRLELFHDLDEISASIGAVQESLIRHAPPQALIAPDPTGDGRQKSAPQQDETGRVSMGAVDFSIAFLNRRFRRRDGRTRFEMLWLQDREWIIDETVKYPPEGRKAAGFGTLLLRDDIDALIRRHSRPVASDDDPLEGLDEAAAYREFTSRSPDNRDTSLRRVGHGTAIIDHMAGAEPGEMDDDRPIYAVELPTSVIASPSGEQLMLPLLCGLAAIGAYSYYVPALTGLEPAIPLVMNASLAFPSGPEGAANPNADLLKKLMERFTNHGGREISLTIPAGNHLQDRVHARLPGGTSAQIQWTVPPDDRTPSIVEIFQDGDALDLEEIRIAPPGFDVADAAPCAFADTPLKQDQYSDLKLDDKVIARLGWITSASGRQSLFLKILATGHPSAERKLSPAGLWTIQLRSKREDWRLWIRRDETLADLRPAGRQSRFQDWRYEVFDEQGDFRLADDASTASGQGGVQRVGTVSALAYASGQYGITMVEGLEGSRRTANRPYRFGGVARKGRISSEAKPASAVAEESRVRGGPLAAGRYGRSTVRLAGTSIASALHARHIADTVTSAPSPTGRRVMSEF